MDLMINHLDGSKEKIEINPGDTEWKVRICGNFIIEQEGSDFLIRMATKDDEYISIGWSLDVAKIIRANLNRIIPDLEASEYYKAKLVS